MARDKFHSNVVTALKADGWQIIHDPLRIMIGRRQAYIDLGAKDMFAAKKGDQEIAVEVKSFVGASLLDDLYGAIGQYLLYQIALKDRQPATVLYLALPTVAWQIIEQDQISPCLEELAIKVLTFDVEINRIDQWIN
jgi:uncharacterized protein YfiM (DUF2279 family)